MEGVMMKSNIEKAKKQLMECKNDFERWTWLKNNQELGFVVMLDNDDTFIVHPDDSTFIEDFDGYLGWSDGAKAALDAFGIKWEEV
jgi:hypothetical protein